MQRFPTLSMLGGAVLLLAITSAQAIGFGATVTSTTIGQRLDFSTQLDGDSDTDAALRRECVSADVRAGDDRLAPEQVRASIEDGPRAGERRVRVTTRSTIVEPVVTIDVTVGCTSQISRRFVAFIDPPMLHLADAGGSAAFVPQRMPSQVAPLLDIVNAGRRTRPSGARQRGADGGSADAHLASRRSDSTQRAAVADAGTVPRSATPADLRKARARSPAAPGVPVAAAGPRLRLDAALPSLPAREARPVAAEPARSVAASVMAAQPAMAASGPDASLAALAAERARVQALEATLAQVRNESRGQQKAFAQLQARLREADSERYRNGLVFLLAIGMAFFALLAGVLWMLRPRRVRGARWFETQARRAHASAGAQGASGASAGAEAAPIDTDARLPPVSQPSSAWSQAPPSMLPVTAPASIGGLEVTTVLAPQSHYARIAREDPSANAARGADGAAVATVDDLLDLEQQAEFFAVLGQDDAAVALLAAHLREHRDGSPVPFLHLLDLHRRRGHRGAFERVRIEHGGGFAALVPAWDGADPGRSLEDDAGVLRTLQALWATPPEAMRYIESLLFSQREHAPLFDLDGYRELLLLYGVARDVAAQVDEQGADGIDVYLPLDDVPTQPLRRDAGGYAVDLDVSDWAEMPDQPLVILRSAGGRGTA